MLNGVAQAVGGQEGLKVVLEPIPGLTRKDLLGRNGFFLQTPPLDEFSRDYGHSHTDYETVSTGQFSRKSGGRNLRTITFDTLVVDFATWAFYDDSPIEQITAKLIEICESGDPVLLTAAHDLPHGGYGNWDLTLVGPEVQYPATLRTLRVAERAGEGDARYMNLSFVEYRDPNVDRTGLGGSKRAGSKNLPTTVTLFMDGHATSAAGKAVGKPPSKPVTMALLAKTFYGDPTAWKLIAETNAIRGWGANDALVLYPGYRTMLKKGGSRAPLPSHASKFRDVRVAKIKIPTRPDPNEPVALGFERQPTN